MERLELDEQAEALAEEPRRLGTSSLAETVVLVDCDPGDEDDSHRRVAA